MMFKSKFEVSYVVIGTFFNFRVTKTIIDSRLYDRFCNSPLEGVLMLFLVSVASMVLVILIFSVLGRTLQAS